jgi:hypothetical protein
MGGDLEMVEGMAIMRPCSVHLTEVTDVRLELWQRTRFTSQQGIRDLARDRTSNSGSSPS